MSGTTTARAQDAVTALPTLRDAATIQRERRTADTLAYLRGHVLAAEASGTTRALNVYLASVGSSPSTKNLPQYREHADAVRRAVLILRPPSGRSALDLTGAAVAPVAEVLPEEAAWREADHTTTREATTLGPPDEEMERHLANFNAAHDEDSAGSAKPDEHADCTNPDPTADPAEQDRDEDEHEPALDEAPMVINSNPAPLELAPGPIGVGKWEPSGKDGAKS